MDGGTEALVELDTADAYKDVFEGTSPKALQQPKELAERARRPRRGRQPRGGREAALVDHGR
jgi:hypothetical protein